jgi:type II secretory pathway pseudopilin PulG
MPTGKSAGQFAGQSTQSGFAYLFVLMLLALIGMGLAAAGTLWSTEVKREREAELLFIGEQYRQAISSYYEREPGQPRLPQSIDDLLEDRRGIETAHHLRRAYRDPFTGKEFELIRSPDAQGISGVHSPSNGRPLKVSGFSAENGAFAEAATYAGWQFVFTATAPVAPVSPAKTGAPRP